MGLLPGRHHSSWFDPGRFWSGDDLGLTGGATLGTEIAVQIPALARTVAGARDRAASER
jgi:hypothetical protein